MNYPENYDPFSLVEDEVAGYREGTPADRDLVEAYLRICPRPASTVFTVPHVVSGRGHVKVLVIPGLRLKFTVGPPPGDLFDVKTYQHVRALLWGDRMRLADLLTPTYP